MSVRLRDQYCPNCKRRIDAVTAADGRDILPEKGDVTLCFYCGSLLRYDEELIARIPDPEFFNTLPVEIKRSVAKARLVMFQMRTMRN